LTLISEVVHTSLYKTFTEDEVKDIPSIDLNTEGQICLSLQYMVFVPTLILIYSMCLYTSMYKVNKH